MSGRGLLSLAHFKRILLVGQWWDKLDESNISYKNSSKDVNMNTSIVAISSILCVFVVNNNLMFRNLKK